jgi:hypothetical protein
MSQPKTPNPEIPDNLKAVHHPLPNSSVDSEISCSETIGSGEPAKPPKPRPPTLRELWSNNLPWSNHEPNEPILFDIDELLVVNGRRRNGLILFKHYHAEFAGPGAAVGGDIDRNCQLALPLGNFSLLQPESSDERQRAYALRRQWIRLTNQITNNPDSLQRAQMILNQFEHYFDSQTMAQLPDEALALLIGVLPRTVRMARSLKT